MRAAGQRSLYVKSSSVPGPYHVDHHLPERLPLLLGQVLEDVAVLLLQQFEAHCQVVVLQDGLVVVHQRQLGICQNSTNMDSVCMQCGTPQRALGTAMFVCEETEKFPFLYHIVQEHVALTTCVQNTNSPLLSPSEPNSIQLT